MVTFEVSKELIKKIDNMGKETPEILKNAINNTAKEARKQLAEEAQRTYVLKTVKFNKSMKIKNSTKRKLMAVIETEGKVLPLSDYKAIKGSLSTGAKAKALTMGNLKALVLEGADNNGKDLKAFITKVKAGNKTHRGIFQRVSGSYMKNKSPRTMKNGRRTKGRQAIKQFYSSSVPKILGSEERVYGSVEPNIRAELIAEINKHASRILGG